MATGYCWRVMLLLLLSALLSGCGGGGNSAPSAPVITPMPPPTNAPPRRPLLYGYFGISRREEIAEIADHVNVVMCADWGDWATPVGRAAIGERIIGELLEARRLGILQAIVTVGFCCFEVGTHRWLGTSEVTKFRHKLAMAGVLDMVIALYILDEPDMLGIPDDIMNMAFNDVRAAWPGPALAVIYGDHGTPGFDSADWIGHDAYDRGRTVLDQGIYAAAEYVRPDQHLILIPGGSDPWRTDPIPFAAYALLHSNVIMLMPFVWFDRERDEQNIARAGIRSNGMAGIYRRMSKELIGEKKA